MGTFEFDHAAYLALGRCRSLSKNKHSSSIRPRKLPAAAKNIPATSKNIQEVTLLDTDTIISLLIKKISYDCRYYNYCQIFNLQLLEKLCNELGTHILRNKILLQPSIGDEIMVMIDAMLAWIADLDHTVQP